MDFSKAELDAAAELVQGSGVTWQVMHSPVYMAEDRARILALMIASKQAEHLMEISDQLSRIEHNTRED